MYLPEQIKKELSPTEEYSLDGVGKSGGSVLLFPKKVLKIQPSSLEAENEYIMTDWLSGRLPVPEIIAYTRQEGKSYTLMTRIPGQMANDGYYLSRPDLLTGLLAEAMSMIWSVDASGCPSLFDLSQKLEKARGRLSQVDVNAVLPDTFGPDGFEGPEALYDYLSANRPKEDLMLTHGDLCLPNIFFEGHRISGFIDLGLCCLSDRHQDLALCCRSLKYNLMGAYGGEAYPPIEPQKLYKKLDMTPDEDKLRYYLLLDELF